MSVIIKGGSSADLATVKPASTPADAADPALVVAISPNSPLTVTGALTDAEIRATPLPVSGPLTDSELRATDLPVTGTVTANAGTDLNTSALALDVTLTDRLNTLGQKTMANSAPVVLASDQGAISVTLTSGSIEIGTVDQGTGGASAWKVDGSAVTQPVSGTFYQATQPVSIAATVAVSGPLTDTQLRATPVPVSGPLTDTQLRATALPVSGTVAVSGSVAVTGPLTDTQIRATALPVSGTVTANAGTGTMAVSAASLPLPSGAATETTLDAVNTKTPSLGQAVMASSVPVVIASNQGAVPVSGTFYQATQPVSIAASVAVTGPLTDTQLRATAVPVSGPLTDTQIRATALPISGTVTANVGTTNGLALDATLTGGTAKTQLVGGATAKVLAASTTAVATDPALVVAISPNNTVPVSGTFYQATQPVSVAGSVAVTGPLTDTQIRATALPVSGTVAVSGSVAVTGPLTDTQLRATPVPVSGTVTSNIGTTNGLALDATLTGGTQQSQLKSGAKGSSAAALVTSTSVDANTQALHANVTNFPASQAVTGTFYQATQPVSIAATVAVSGPLTDTQLRATPVPVSGTVTANAGTGTMAVSAASLPLPSGAATAVKQPALGTAGTASADVITVQGVASMTALKVDGSAVTQPVSGTFFQATQPVSIAASVAVTGPLTDTQIRATPLPVSGTVTANAGTNLNTSALALDVTLTGGTQQSKITDGTNIAKVLAASTAAVAADKALVVAISPNNTVPVSIAATVAVSGPLTDTQIRATPLPVSGTVTVNAGTNLNTSALALDTTLTGGTAKSILRGAAKGSTTAADLTSTPQSADRQALDVQIRTSAGAAVDTFGGGTQFADGAARGTATGTLMMGDDGTNIQSVQVTTAGILKVDGTATTQPISGSVTANAGTNLNTSALALDTTLTGGTAKSILRGAAKGSTTAADLTSTPQSVDRQALDVQIRTSTGVAVDTFGGGTQFADGAARGTATGTLMMGDDGTNIQSVQVTTAGILKVDGTATTQPISGTVTANAGTNLNTSALALDATLTGGTAKSILRGAAKGSTTAADLTSTAQSADRQALDVQIRTSAGAVVDTFGGGTQYADGAARGTATGTLMMGDDGTNIQSVTIKGASTAPVAADPALVVTISPNSFGSADATATGALGALNAAVQVNTSGLVGVGFQLAAGTLIGTLVAEISYDGGTTWISTLFDDSVLGNKASTIVFAGSNAATARSVVGAGGAGLARVRVSAYTSGTANITVRASTLHDPSLMSTGQPGAATLPPVALQVGGTDGTSFRAIAVNTLGQQVITQVDGYKATYSANAVATPVASATDIFTITGSASKVVKIISIEVSGIQTTASVAQINIIKRATANSGGSSASITPVSNDSANSTATATLLIYSANPTLGSTVTGGTIRGPRILIPTAASTTAPVPWKVIFGGTGQMPTLRSTSQVIAVNLGGVTLTGSSINVSIEWTEE